MPNKLLAKPSGLTLSEHTENVIAEGKRIVESYLFLVEKYKVMTKQDLAKRLEGACKFHDEGKSHERWQTACRKDYQVFLDWQRENGGDFNDFQKAIKNTGEHLMKAQIRHEISSVVKCPKLPCPTLASIAAHHGKLSKHHENKWLHQEWKIEGSEKAWERFATLSNDYVLQAASQFREVLKRHYEFAGVRGLLQLADVRASITENGGFIPPFIPFEYNFPKAWAKRPVQQIAEENWKDNLLLIRAPTGAGKTAASLLWANQQIQNKRADRLIIAMPTRFTSNALAISVKDDLSETGLYHSSAWFKEFHEKSKESREARHEAKMLHEFARKLLTPVTVCTIDHLLMCLTLSREDHHSIAFNLAHSCVVIDEADFYDDFTQANILVLLEALDEWKVPVMIMSASLPESSLKMYQSAGFDFDVKEIKQDNSDNTRYRCEVKSILEYEEVNELSELLSKCTKQPAIIYANTVAKAIGFYDWFEKNTDIKPMLYHSRFTEPDKLKKEKVLIENLGSEAWKNGTANGVAILTQIGEMSINISADLMISDVCPIDRLVQRAGRLCRFDKEKIGALHIAVPYQTKKEGRNIYPAPYGSMENRKWEISDAMRKTIDFLKLQSYSAQDFVDIINIVYEKLEDFSFRSKENAKLLKEQFAYNWIVLPKANSEIDDTETTFWKSRDIENSTTVLTDFPENPYFSNYMDWQEFKISNSVDLPNYLIRKGRKKDKVYQSTVYLKDEKINIWRTHEGVYGFEKGLCLEDEQDIIL